MIDRSQTVRFAFDGAELAGHPGDTLASALLANGIRLVGRSFKYHRPRGILTAGSEEPSALVELRKDARREPNTRATTIELYDGLSAASQNRWPSLKFDVLAANQLFAPIFSAGFYYKTFMWPPSFWEKVYEPMIRRAAGLGRGAAVPDPDHYEKAYAFCDVLVVGAGPAGLAAALAAARSGARVILCEEDFRLGGRLLAERYDIDGSLRAIGSRRSRPSSKQCQSAASCGARRCKASMTAAPMPRSSGSAIMSRTRLCMSRASGCGASWRSALSSAQARSSAPSCSATTTGPASCWLEPCAATSIASAWRRGGAPSSSPTMTTRFRTASDLALAGIEIAAVVDGRRTPSRAAQEAAEAAKARYFAGAAIGRVRGRHGVKGVEVRDAKGGRESIACDLIAVSGGWNPTLHLTTHLNGKPQWNDSLAALVPGTLPPGMSVAGAATRHIRACRVSRRRRGSRRQGRDRMRLRRCRRRAPACRR